MKAIKAKQNFLKFCLVSGSILSIGIASLTTAYPTSTGKQGNTNLSNQQVTVSNLLDWGDKLGSLLAGVSAVIAVGYSIWQYRTQLEQQQASEIRLILRGIAKDSAEIFNRLEKGECLTVAASTVTKELKSRLGESATIEDIKNLLKDEHLMKSVATVGWYSSPLSTKCEESIHQLKQNLISLNGDLCILAEATKLYIKLIQFKCSPTVFIKALLEAGKELNSNNNNGSKFLNQLNKKLQECSIDECVYKYNDDLERINNFISGLSYALIDLDDSLLLKISKSRTIAESETNYNISNFHENECKNKDKEAKEKEKLEQTIKEITKHSENLKKHLEKICEVYNKEINNNFAEKIIELTNLTKSIEICLSKELDNEKNSSTEQAQSIPQNQSFPHAA